MAGSLPRLVVGMLRRLSGGSVARLVAGSSATADRPKSSWAVNGGETTGALRCGSFRRDASAQTEPIAALAAVLAVGLGLALYVGVAADSTPEPERSGADPTLERLSSVAVTNGTVAPSVIPHPDEIAADGYRATVTLQYDGRERRYGPDPPADADRAERPVAVRIGPGVRHPGRLVVEVWS